ncbi:MAG: alpha/beta hydrolase [Acidobacteria bacterium]|nr:alpha/beta hydrolase [Acidobacteriota bacterium]
MFRISRNEKIRIWEIMLSCMILFLITAMPLQADGLKCPTGSYQVGTACVAVSVPGEGAWNGDLVVFAHGYISPTIETPVIEDYEVPPGSGQKVSMILNSLGYAFATTSYSDNGLAIPQAVEDIKDLADHFLSLHPPNTVDHIYLVGASEGGLVATLALEKYPEFFDGGLAICGPVGDFRKQINYFGDFLVLFNYFFPDLLASFTGGVIPTPAFVPDGLVDQVLWDTKIAPAVLAAIGSNPSATRQLLKVANAPTDPDDPASAATTVLGALWYGIFATNDAVEKMGGSPYDNSRRWYSGSRNDWRLNRRIDRFHADLPALYYIDNYLQTSGRLTSPLVTAHTTQDPIVPYWHETIYNLKTLFSGSLLHHLNIPVSRYGHCAFTQEELLTAFAVMLFMSGGY